MVFPESFRRSIKRNDSYVDKILQEGENFLRGDYHRTLGRYLKERPSYLIVLPIFAGSILVSHASGHPELTVPGLYSIISTPISALGEMFDHLTTKSAFKANERYKELTGNDYFVEYDKKRLNKDGEYNPDKIKLGTWLLTHAYLGFLVPIAGITWSAVKFYAGIHNKKMTAECNEKIKELEKNLYN